ncbi:reverse transcriptase domain-containing protein [Tanacetum coccineum]
MSLRNVRLPSHAFSIMQCIGHVPEEKSHLMVKEGIVLGHKISKKGIEVDKAKIDVIAKLPHPTTIKGVWSFLGYAGFYRRFIKDFSKISRPMTHLLEKNTPFIFSDDCIQAFQTLKKKLTEAPILIAPDWDLPFEFICDASNFAIGKIAPVGSPPSRVRFQPPLWNQIALIMRNKPDIDEIDIDDLYNNLRVYEDEMKRSLSSTSTSQNLEFLSSKNTSSTNEVSTAGGVFGVSTAGGISQVSSTPCAHDVACSFFAQPTTSHQLENEDF